MSETTATENATTSASIKERVGIVVSTKMDKSIAVKVTRRVPHPLYKKIIKISKRLIAHDEEGQAQEGDTVRVEECRPMSKRKRWVLKEIVKH
ncbi:MAG: 30S ribosomal protein S17 [Verrucomicrobiota bacterium]